MAYVLVIFSVVVAGIFSYPLDSKPENDTAKDSFQPVSLPADFGSYDPNANGYIDLGELAKVTGTTLDDARKPFMDADVDDDDQVSPAEFEKAPWSLSTANREEVVSEDDDEEEQAGDSDDEEQAGDNDEEQAGDDNEEEEHASDNEEEQASDDNDEEQAGDNDEEVPVDENDEKEAPTGESDAPREAEVDESDYDEEDALDNDDDMLVDVGTYTEGDDADKSPVEKSDGDEDNEKIPVEYDDELRNVESDDAVDPLLVDKEDPLSKQQDVISENEFVENAIF